ncbi:MAG TPA: efflux RND transporter permease subunit [Candidatus Acidoferrales bacterium]|jgi:multidrug efflux pump subunit AcrB|nr:efflux RND transporter permease subunit [Candidatus Acidoferrales bacterium]
MMWLVRLALQRPYTFVVMAILIAILGLGSIFTMPVDIFPAINIPVISVIWTYTGLLPDDMEKRIVLICERAMTTTVDDIQHIESRSYPGVAVIRVYFQPNVHVELAFAQVTALVQTLLRTYPQGTFPPLIVKYDASSVPIIQLGVNSPTLSEQDLADFAQNFIRTDLARIEGASIPLPYGGKTRSIMVDIDPRALYAYQTSPSDISAAIGNQAPIIPAGTAKMGTREYFIQTNSSPAAVEEFNMLPVKTLNGSTVYMKDIGHVRNGFAVQTNIVRQDGTRGALLTVLKHGETSTLKIVSDVKKQLPSALAGLPKDLKVTPLFDQSVYVRASVWGVVREATIAAILTGLMILLFLGSLRSTMIVCASIPLSILTSIIILHMLGESLNVMTLGGLALAVGILVDDATVEIENTNRNIAMKKPIVRAILDGAQQIATPTLISSLSICIVFVPVLLLQGAAKYLFTPLGMAVVFAMLTSYMLTRTLVPTMMHYLMKAELPLLQRKEDAPARPEDGWIWKVHKGFDKRFEKAREKYRESLYWIMDNRPLVAGAFAAFALLSLVLVLFVGRDFFPTVDTGQIRIHIRPPVGTRIEESELLFGGIEGEIRKIIPAKDLQTILDNIGLPNSGINLAFSDTATISNSDGDILVDMKKRGSTELYTRRIREMIHQRYPGVTVFFLPADMTTQILNFGLPAIIDVQVSGRDVQKNYQIAKEIRDRVANIPGTADVIVFQEPNYPTIGVNVDRSKADLVGVTQQAVATNMLISLSATGQINPIQWVDPKNGVSYNVLVQTPQYRLDSLTALGLTPVSSGPAGTPAPVLPTGEPTPMPASLSYGDPGAQSNPTQFLGNLASFRRSTTPEAVDHYDIRPVYDVEASLDRRDLGGVASDIRKIIKEYEKQLPQGSKIDLRGQAETMNDSFLRLGLGIIFAIVLVYLLMAVNFQSWIDPLIVLATIPGTLAGILWVLFVTHTTLNVPSLMGSIMAIGVATANSILLVTFANDEQIDGKKPIEAAISAGYVRVRPVLMTALAMIIGMLPMALAFGEAGQQNAPLGRAVIGGLLVATVSTLFFIPIIYSFLRKEAPIDFAKQIEKEAEGKA